MSANRPRGQGRESADLLDCQVCLQSAGRDRRDAAFHWRKPAVAPGRARYSTTASAFRGELFNCSSGGFCGPCLADSLSPAAQATRSPIPSPS